MWTAISILLFIISIVNFLGGGFLTDAFGFSATSPLCTRISYLLCHVGMVHFALNAYGIFILHEFVELICEKNGLSRRFSYLFPLFMIALAVLATFGTELSRPTVGLSGVLCAYMGFVAAWQHNKGTLALIATFVMFNLIGFFTDSMNIGLHILSFFYGAVFSFVLFVKKTIDSVDISSLKEGF